MSAALLTLWATTAVAVLPPLPVAPSTATAVSTGAAEGSTVPAPGGIQPDAAALSIATAPLLGSSTAAVQPSTMAPFAQPLAPFPFQQPGAAFGPPPGVAPTTAPAPPPGSREAPPEQ